jgi:hypothetical protein
VYPSAAVVVRFDVAGNRQAHFQGHNDDITWCAWCLVSFWSECAHSWLAMRSLAQHTVNLDIVATGQVTPTTRLLLWTTCERSPEDRKRAEPLCCSLWCVVSGRDDRQPARNAAAHLRVELANQREVRARPAACSCTRVVVDRSGVFTACSALLRSGFAWQRRASEGAPARRSDARLLQIGRDARFG